MIKLHIYLTDRGFTPKTQILDNEFPGALKRHFHPNNIEIYLVPLHLHRVNKADNAISPLKYQFIAGLLSINSSFLIYLWCRLLPNDTTTINLLRTSTINPRISAEAQLNVAFDYNKTPLALTCTKIIAYVTPDG